jgi:hypothetical protein
MKMIINFKQESILSEDFVGWIKKVNIVGIIRMLPMWVGLSVGGIILKCILKSRETATPIMVGNNKIGRPRRGWKDEVEEGLNIMGIKSRH